MSGSALRWVAIFRHFTAIGLNALADNHAALNINESSLFIQIEQGVVVSERVVMNGEASTPARSVPSLTKTAIATF